MQWIVFALAAPFFYSLTNYIEKFILDKKIKNPVVLTISGGLIYCLIGIVISVIHPLHNLGILPLISIFLAGIFLVLYLIPYFLALAIDETSRVVPLFQFVPVFTIIISSLFLGEKLQLIQILGFIFIVVGGFVVGIEKFERGILTPRKSFWLMIISSLLYSLVEILFKITVSISDFWTTFFYQSLGVGFGSLILLIFKNTSRDLINTLKTVSAGVKVWLILSQLFGFIGEFSGSYAISIASVSLVSVIGGLQPLFVLIFGICLSLWLPNIIKEDLSKHNVIVKFVSVILIFIGIFFIYK